jgi:hypothetical protein
MTVLSREGSLSLDPSSEYSRSSSNRLVFRGVEIVPGIQIGVIEANDADRDTVAVNGAVRYGLTNRREVEARMPYVRRSDRVTTVAQRDETVSRTMKLDGQHLGDVEFAGRYQLTSGARGRPIFVGNLRIKTPTGRGPFRGESRRIRRRHRLSDRLGLLGGRARRNDALRLRPGGHLRWRDLSSQLP